MGAPVFHADGVNVSGIGSFWDSVFVFVGVFVFFVVVCFVLWWVERKNRELGGGGSVVE